MGHMVENIVGCKWSLHVLAQIRKGVNRPGQLVRTHDGLTTKVLNERLRKMVRYGILQRVAHPEIPPRVEYNITEFGRHFAAILDQIELLQQQIDHAQTPSLSPHDQPEDR